jgi:hypothetical protein
MYKVIFDNGTTSDIVDLETINRWVGFGRVRPWTILTDIESGKNLRADEIEDLRFPGPKKSEPISVVAEFEKSVPMLAVGSHINAWAFFILGCCSLGFLLIFFGPGFMILPLPSLFFLVGIRQSDRGIALGFHDSSLPKFFNTFMVFLLLALGVVIGYAGFTHPPR